MLRALLRPSHKPRATLPHVEAIEARVWSEGLWTGLVLGFAIGFGAAVVLLLK
jgi:hypothetical protein